MADTIARKGRTGMSMAMLLLLCLNSLVAGNQRQSPGTVPYPVPSDFFPRSNLQPSVFPDPAVSTDTPVCVVPFRRAGNLVLIEATADTTKGYFILDTGAPNLVLNITYFREYTITPGTSSGGLTGSIPLSGQTSINELSFGTYNWHRVQADMISLGHIEDSRNLPIYGLLGVNLFKRFEIIIDYETNLVHFRLLNRKNPDQGIHDMLRDTGTYHIFPMDVVENKIITKAEIEGKKLNFIVDTGAETNVLDSRLSNKIFENVSISRRVTLSGTGDQKVEALYGDLKQLRMNDVDFGHLPVLITNLKQLCFAYDYCVDGMLGFDFLLANRIGFNFVKEEMYVWK